jgi:hypothetical protein
MLSVADGLDGYFSSLIQSQTADFLRWQSRKTQVRIAIDQE